VAEPVGLLGQNIRKVRLTRPATQPALPHESITFERLDGGRTRLRGHAVYPTMEARDGMVGSGMEVGMNAGYAKLDDVLDGIEGGL